MISAKEATELVKTSRLNVTPSFDDAVKNVLELVEREIILYCDIGEYSTVFDIYTRNVPDEYTHEKILKLIANSVSRELIKLGYTVSIKKQYYSHYPVFSLEIDWSEKMI
jgi:hypothetical protein